LTEVSAKFTHRNESFNCVHCGASVLPAEKSCRNHCPVCLHSVHLDNHPGDRLANCGGLLRPIHVEYHTKKGYQLVHQCQVCGHQTKNIVNLTDAHQPDSMDAVLALMKRNAQGN
jgi:RNHCP domain